MKVIQIGICALVVFSVLAFGGVQLWAQAVLEVGTAILFLIWAHRALRQQRIEVCWNWLYLPLLGFWAFVLIQYIFGISVSPYLTKIQLFKWTAYLLFCFLTTEAFRMPEQRRTFAWFLICFCFLASLFALVQYFTSNGKLYWIIALPQGSAPFGSFVNYNHFAGFIELADPTGLALLLSGSVRREKILLLSLFAIIPIAALVISGSRGGITSFFIQMLLLVWILRNEMVGKRKLAAMAGLGIITVALVFWLGAGHTAQRFSNLASEKLSKDTRALIYENTWRIFRDHYWVGTGSGTLAVVYPHYETHYDPRLVEHAHNDYLEFLSETGMIGALFGAGFIVILFWKGSANLRAARNFLRSAETRALYAGSLVACIGLLVHGLVDFNLQIPVNAALFFILAALTSSETHHRNTFIGPERTQGVRFFQHCG